MKISINSIRGLNKRYRTADDIAPDGVDELAVKIGAQLGGIEEVIDIGSKYQGIIVSKVVECEKHPNADKLNVCKIDDGGKAKGVERDENGYVQVVCGAPNVRTGLTVAWLPPGSMVPESTGKEPFVLGSRELRGVVSNGMLASSRELAIGENHEGIMELDGDIAPGADFAEQFELAGDVVLDIENKMFTHRPDCFGFLGVSRELAGIQGMPFKSPEWYRTDVEVPEPETEELPLEVRNEVSELVPRFTAIAMSDVKVETSPVWLQIELSKVGLRPINNIVDLTNFFMLETGQPLHAYDYDKVKALGNGDQATIVVRKPQKDEKIRLLNGKEIEPRDEAIMIATDKELIGVGGVMGGADTEVDETTKNIIIEVANFNIYSIRRTSMAHGLFTDAVSRFNKGQSPLQTRAVLAKMVDDVRRLAGGKVASSLIDDNHVPEEVQARNSVYPPVEVLAEFVNVRLGLRLSAEEMQALLTNVEFDVIVDGDKLTVKAPFWRTDIEIPEDVVEEVGRLYGYDRLPQDLPVRPMAPAVTNPKFDLKQRLRDSLSRAGANEVLSYSFVHGDLLDKSGQDRGHAFSLGNALSPDLQYYRLSLIPSLLERVHPNIKAGYDSFALFEIGKGHVKGKVDADGLPLEFERVALVFAAGPKAAAKHEGAAYYQAVKFLTAVIDDLDIADPLRLEPILPDDHDSNTSYYATGRSATVWVGEHKVGRIGEFSPTVRKKLKLPDYAAGFELSTVALQELTANLQPYVPLSRYPRVEQDISLRVPANMPYAELYTAVLQSLSAVAPQNTTYLVMPVDIYQQSDTADQKHITLRLLISSYDKTLRDAEVAGMFDKVAEAVAVLGAVRI